MHNYFYALSLCHPALSEYDLVKGQQGWVTVSLFLLVSAVQSRTENFMKKCCFLLRSVTARLTCVLCSDLAHPNFPYLFS